MESFCVRDPKVTQWETLRADEHIQELAGLQT